MEKSLETYFMQVKDHRRAQGRRWTLPQFLTMLSMASMSGAHGLREIADFFKSNAQDFIELFGLKHGVPKLVCIRELLGKLDFESVSDAFAAWSSSVSGLEKGDFVALDGKSLGSTVTDWASKRQDFVQITSAFAHRTGAVIDQRRFRHKKVSEIISVREIVARLSGRGFVLTLDALHCQKKQPV